MISENGRKLFRTSTVKCVAPRSVVHRPQEYVRFWKRGSSAPSTVHGSLFCLRSGRGNIWRLATVGAACRAEQPTPLRCFLCVLREQCPLMGRAEFHRQMVLRCLDCYCSESTALNTQIWIGDIGSKTNILLNIFHGIQRVALELDLRTCMWNLRCSKNVSP